MEIVRSGEFNRAIEGLSAQIARVEAMAHATLVQTTKTNGRVDALEGLTKRHGAKLDAIQPVNPDNSPLTKRDLWVVMGTLCTVGGLVTFLLTLWAARG